MNYSPLIVLWSAVTLLASTPLAAGQADICYSPGVPATSSGSGNPLNSTVFTCPQAGDKTLPQLAAAGWSVVQMLPVMISSTHQSNQLLIQKP